MPFGLLLALAAMLMLSVLLATLALVNGGTGRALRDRVRGLSGEATTTATKTVLPNIRVGNTAHGAFVLRVCRAVRFNPDIPQEQLIAWPLVALIAAAAGGAVALGVREMVGNLVAIPMAPIVAVLTARGIFGWQHARYSDAVFRQIPDTLGLMVRAIRAGLPLAEALRSIGREMPSPTRDEFSRVVGDMAIGRPVEAALMRLHERTGLAEYAFLAVTLGLQAQTGGSLAETLDNLSEMVRKRVAMAKRAQAMAGEAKAQAALLLVLPFIAAAAMAFIQPFYVATFTQNPTGQRMAQIALGMMLMGVLSIRWLIRQAGRD